MLTNQLGNLQKNYGLFGLLIVRTTRRQRPPPGKPPILPPSKTKLYTVTGPRWQRSSWVEELLWRRHAYNNAVESLRKVFAQEIKQKELEGLAIEGIRNQELEELDMLIAENEKRNQEAARMREEKYEQEMEQIRQEIAEEIESRLKEEQIVLKQRADEVKEVIEHCSGFITIQNLDQRLNEALEKPVVYDYAIDLKGAKLHDPLPAKYQTGIPARQKGRMYDRTLAMSSAKS